MPSRVSVRLDGGLLGGVEHDHDVADGVGAEVGVPEDQVAGSVPGRGGCGCRCRRRASPVAPAAVRGMRIPIWAYAVWVNEEQS